VCACLSSKWVRVRALFTFHTCRYPHAHEPYPELQAAVAVLSGGPVGPGDKAGSANKTLLMSTCNANGLLLKPSYVCAAAGREAHAGAT
jgi:hypothetical protein